MGVIGRDTVVSDVLEAYCVAYRRVHLLALDFADAVAALEEVGWAFFPSYEAAQTQFVHSRSDRKEVQCPSRDRAVLVLVTLLLRSIEEGVLAWWLMTDQTEKAIRAQSIPGSD